MKYVVLFSKDSQDLEKLLNDRAAEGWRIKSHSIAIEGGRNSEYFNRHFVIMEKRLRKIDLDG